MPLGRYVLQVCEEAVDRVGVRCGRAGEDPRGDDGVAPPHPRAVSCLSQTVDKNSSPSNFIPPGTSVSSISTRPSKSNTVM